MKKLTKILVVIFVVSVLALTLCACKKDCKGNHQLEKVEATVTCTQAGDIAYWKCSACKKLFKDAEATQEITEDDLPSGPLGHDWGDWGSNTATCLEAGKETRTCKRCGATENRDSAVLRHSFVKEDGSIDTSKLVAEATASCTANGNVAYYQCETCQHYFTVAGTVVTDKGADISAVQIPATGHSFLKADGTVDTSKLVAEAPATCTEDGTAAHYLCSACKHYFVIEDGKPADKGTDISALKIVAAGHSFYKADGTLDTSKLVPEKDPTCTKAGNVAYYLCSTCKHYFTVEDDELIDNGDDIAELQIPALGHSFQKADGSVDPEKIVAEKEPTCEAGGWLAYYLCEDCEHYFTLSDENELEDHGNENEELLIAPSGHNYGTTWTAVENSNPAQHTRTCLNGCGKSETKPCSAGESPAWSSDASGHWHACVASGCQSQLDFVAHEQDALGCAICGWVSDDAAAMLTVGDQTTYYATGDAVNEAILALFPEEGEPAQAIVANVKLFKDAEADHIGALYGAGIVSNMTLVIDLDGHKFTLANSTQFSNGTFTLKNGVIECTAGVGKPAIQVAEGATIGLEALEVKASGSIAVAVLGGIVRLRGADKLEGETALYMLYTGSDAATKVTVVSGATVNFAGNIMYGYMPNVNPADGWSQKLLFVVGGSEKTLSDGELEKLSTENPMNTYETYEAFLAVLVGEDHVHTPVEGVWASNGDANYHYAICDCETIIVDDDPNHKDLHTWRDDPTHKDNKSATCTATGVKVQICNACGQIKRIELAALGHSWGEGTVATPASCTAAGLRAFECSRCGETKNEPIPATGHNYVANVCQNTNCTKKTLTEADVLAKIYDEEGTVILPKAESLKGTYKLTGIIKSIDTAYNANTKIITLTFTVGGHDIICNKMSGGSDLALGNKITVTGTIKNVSGVGIRFEEKCTYVRIWQDAEKVAADKAALTLGKNYDENFTLRSKGTAQNCAITWALKNTADSAYITIGNDNSVTLKGPYGAGVHHEIVLVATITSGSVSDTKEFTINVADSWEEFAVTYSAPQHATMTVESAEGAVASGAAVISGETVTVTLTLETGYKLASYTVNGTKTTAAANATSFEIIITAATTFSVEVVEKYTSKSLTAFYTLTKGTKDIQVTGTITGINGSNVYIQDESGKALLVYVTGTPDTTSYVVGNRITVAGEVDIFNGLYELKPVEVISSVPATPIAATELTEKQVGNLGAGDASKYVTIKGLVFQSVASGNYTFMMGETSVVLRPTSNSPAAKILAQLQAGDTIDAVGVFVGYYNAVQIAPSKAAQIVVQWTLSATAANSEVAKGSTVKVNVTTNPSFRLNGIQDGDTVILSGLGTITYTSSDPSVASVDSTGVVTGLEQGTVTITVSVGGKTTTTQQIEVKASVPKKNVTFNFNEAFCDVTAELANGALTLNADRKVVSVAQNDDLSFTVVPKTGYVLQSVTAGGTALTPDGNTYTVKVSDTTIVNIVVEAKAGWCLVEDISELSDGDKIVIVAADGTQVMASHNSGNYREITAVTVANGKISTLPATAQIITLASANDGLFKLCVANAANESDKRYLKSSNTSSGSNYLYSEAYPTTGDTSAFDWSITIAAKGVATIKATMDTVTRYIKYNSTNTRFSTYVSGQADVAIYKLYPCTTHSADEWQNNATSHWKVCSACGTTFVTHSNSGYACDEEGCTWTAQTEQLTISATGGTAGTDFTLTPTSGVTAAKNEGYVGYEVKFTITGVASGKTASVSIVADGKTVPCTKGEDGAYSFIMPNSAVTITVTLSDSSNPPQPAVLFKSDVSSAAGVPQDTVTAGSFTNGYTAVQDFTLTNNSIAVKFNGYGVSQQSGYYRFGGKASITNIHESDKYGGYLQTTEAFDKEITKIILNVKALDSSLVDVKLYVYNGTLPKATANPDAVDNWYDIVTIAKADIAANEPISFTPSDDKTWSAGVTFRIVVTKSTKSSNTGLDITGMEFWGR